MRVFSKKSRKRSGGILSGISAISLGWSFCLFSNASAVSAQDTYLGPSILPPAPGAIDGGNPFQGLGRSDDPGPSREKQFGFPTYNSSGFNANGMQDTPPPTINSDSYANYSHPEAVNSSGGGSSVNGSYNGYGSNANQSNSAPNNFPGGFIPTSMLDSPLINANQGATNVQAPAPPSEAQSAVVPNLPPGFAGQAGFGNIPGGNVGASGNNLKNINMDNNNAVNINTAAPTQTPIPPDGAKGNATAGSEGTNISGSSGTLSGNSGYSPSGGNFSAGGGAGGVGGVSSIGSVGSVGRVGGVGGVGGVNAANGNGGLSSFNAGAGARARTPAVPATTGGTATPSNSSSVYEKDSLLGSPSEAKSAREVEGTAETQRTSALVPPPPGTPPNFALDAGKNFSNVHGGKAATSSPLGKAVEQVKSGRLQDALLTINDVLQTDRENANAHYLKAVVSVLNRRFNEAKIEYLATLKYSHNEELTSRARVGLNKLAH